LRMRIAGVEPPAAAASGAAGAASGAAGAASGTATSDAAGWTWFSQAYAQAAGGAQGGGLAAMRERLVSGLQLDLDQQAKLDAISADMRPKFMAMRDLAETDRGPVRARLMQEMQQRISAMLNPNQRAAYEQMQARATAAAASGGASAPANAATRPVMPGGTGAAAAIAGSASSAARASPSAQAVAPAPGAPAVAGAGGGPLAEFRNRLVGELQLTADQAAKVDAIFAESRPKFMALRDLAAEERPKARDRILADLRAKVADVLSAEQKVKYAALLAEAGARTNTRGRIYLMGEDGKPKAFNVRLGITDGSSTELLVAANGPNAAELKEGAMVIVGIQPGTGGSATPNRAPAGPRLPF